MAQSNSGSPKQPVRGETRASVIRKIFSNVGEFISIQALSGIVLLFCAGLAMWLANSAFGDVYQGILATKFGPTIAGHSLELSVAMWINDALMAIFFFMVGMEIKHELTEGALASFDRAFLPVAAAVGGMIIPALIYVLIGPSGPAASGWGIPMATDIAFAVGVMALLGKRVPAELKIFLLALAIADDLGAVLVIAIFYTTGTSLLALGVAAALAALVWFLARKGIRHTPIHLVLGIAVWLAVHESGVHATIAGVVLGFLMPHTDANPDDGQTPLSRWVHILHPYVSFGIMPIFALANAGVQLGAVEWDTVFSNPLINGVSYGLLLGKPIGIFGFTFIAVKLGLARLPAGVTLAQVLGAGFLGGIGFTMALFVAQLALPVPADLALAKVGIIKGSLLAAVIGTIVLFVVYRPSTPVNKELEKVV